eukprot:UN01622
MTTDWSECFTTKSDEFCLDFQPGIQNRSVICVNHLERVIDPYYCRDDKPLDVRHCSWECSKP